MLHRIRARLGNGVEIRPLTWTVIVAIAGLAVASLAISPALGGPGFLTTQKARRSFLPLHHSIRLIVPPQAWVASDLNGAQVFPDVGSASLTHNGGRTGFFAPLDIPQAIGGQSVHLKSFELCYEVENFQSPTKLVSVSLNKTANQTATDPAGVTTFPIRDGVDRTDATCRTYEGRNPVTIRRDDMVEIQLYLKSPGGGTIKVYRLDLNLQT